MTSLLEQSVQEYMDYLDGKPVDMKVNTRTIPVKEELDGETIKSLRKQIDVTQKGLAELIGVSTRTVEGWESNRTHPSRPLQKLLGLLIQNNKIANDLRFM